MKGSIYGIGMDLIEIARIQRAMERHGTAFLRKLFTESEQKGAPKTEQRYAYYAARFAAKEAVGKALGTGIRGSVTWLGIEIGKDIIGKPCVLFHDDTQRFVVEELGVDHVLITMTHAQAHAAATAVACVDGMREDDSILI